MTDASRAVQPHKDLAMLAHTHAPHRPHHPVNDVPDDSEPGSLPAEPDQGPIPTDVPDHPDREGGERTATRLIPPRRPA